MATVSEWKRDMGVLMIQVDPEDLEALKAGYPVVVSEQSAGATGYPLVVLQLR